MFDVLDTVTKQLNDRNTSREEKRLQIESALKTLSDMHDVAAYGALIRNHREIACAYRLLCAVRDGLLI